MKVKSESEVAQSSPTLSAPWTAAHQAPLSMGFSRREHWGGVPLPSSYTCTEGVKKGMLLLGETKERNKSNIEGI